VGPNQTGTLSDDQQLAAIGAGGVLRDIKHIHGALQLTELHRFTDPAEATASLALREGRPEALNFYLDHDRVHVGDIATTTHDAFAAWVSDRAAGLDTIMLAPTRKLVNELNRQARDHLLRSHPAGREVRLADGNQASVGDVIITRTNDRRLHLAANDWVKNGDRWTVTHVGKRGDLTVRHNRSNLTTRLPADYVRTSTGLGYATTIHAAQGVTADTMHGLATGQESRQQLYTMLTRGRVANHLYLQVVGDGDPHTLVRPDTVSPRTPTETLQQILARDEAPASASTLLRRLSDPASQLFEAVQRYTDGLKVAAEQLVGPQVIHTLDGLADQIIPELTSEPSWPTLRAHLLVLTAGTGEHPLVQLYEAALGRDLSTAEDMAAVLDWRLPEPASIDPGPLPWLPGIPSTLHDHHVWGQYLAKRSQLVSRLADQVRDYASQSPERPVWAPPGSHLTAALLGEVAVWRAAYGVDSQDRRATGPEQLQISSAEWQRHLERRIAHASDNPTNSDIRTQEAGSTFQVRRDKARQHWPRPSANNRRSGQPRLGR
jgi:AAA domain-containing protein